MIKHIIVENEREVDIVYSEEQLTQRLDHGWKVVVDLSDYGWNQDLGKSHNISLAFPSLQIRPPIGEKHSVIGIIQLTKV